MFIVDEITKMDVFTLYQQSLGAVGVVQSTKPVQFIYRRHSDTGIECLYFYRYCTGSYFIFLYLDFTQSQSQTSPPSPRPSSSPF